MRINWATVCPAIRIGTSGKVRGMRAECPGVPFQATNPNPPQPPPVLRDSTKVQEHCKLTSDPSTRSQSEIKRSATTPSRPRYEYNPRSLTNPSTATGNPSRELEQTLTRLGHHKAPNTTITISDGRKTARCTFLRVTALALVTVRCIS